MTKVNLITEERILRNTFLFENIMFTNKVNQSIFWGGKGKDRVFLIKTLINARV
jgi:hypothetical protein